MSSWRRSIPNGYFRVFLPSSEATVRFGWLEIGVNCLLTERRRLSLLFSGSSLSLSFRPERAISQDKRRSILTPTAACSPIGVSAKRPCRRAPYSYIDPTRLLLASAKGPYNFTERLKLPSLPFICINNYIFPEIAARALLFCPQCTPR
jgi:hypothetical protein